MSCEPSFAAESLRATIKPGVHWARVTASPGAGLWRRDANLRDDRPPQFTFTADEIGKFPWAHGPRVISKLLELFDDFGPRQRRAEVGIDLLHNGPRRALRCDQDGPTRGRK